MRDYSNSQFESRPLQGSVVDLVNQNEQFNANRRAEKLEKEKFQYLKDDRDRTWRENFLKENLKQQDFIDIKDADLNNLYARTITKAMDNAGEIAMRLAYGKGTPEDRVKLHLLNQTSDKLKALSTSMGDVIQKFNNGKLHDDPELRAYLKNLGQAEIDFSEKGELELVVPSENGAKRIPYSDAIKGVDGFKLIPNLDPYKGFAEFTKDIKPEETESYDGYETTKKKGVSTQLATQLAETFLYPSNIMSNHLKSALKKAGFDPFNLTADAANYAIKLKDELAQQLINSNERFDKTEYNWTADNNAKSLKQRKKEHQEEMAIKWATEKRQANKDAQESKIGVEGITLGELTKADDSVMLSASKTFGPLYKYRSITGKDLDVGSLVDSKGKVYDDAKVTGYTYDKKTKSLVLRIEYTSGEVLDKNDNPINVKKNVKAIKVNSATEGRVASILGGNTESLRNSIMQEDTKPKIDY